jgi:hypothetical protein
MKIISIIKTIFSNLISPKFRFVYTTRKGQTDIYIVQNPTAFKGSKKTTFSNPSSREEGDYNIGFRAVCLSRGGEVRSFYYKQMRELQKLSLTEQVII